MKKGPDFCSQAPLVGIPPSSAYEKTALCLIRAVISVGWQSIFGCFIVYPFVHRRKHWLIKQQCYYEERLELIKIILIPIYIFGLTVLVEKETNNVQILYATIIVETIMCILVMRDTKKSSFYKNYIEILELNIDIENNKE